MGVEGWAFDFFFAGAGRDAGSPAAGGAVVRPLAAAARAASPSPRRREARAVSLPVVIGTEGRRRGEGSGEESVAEMQAGARASGTRDNRVSARPALRGLGANNCLWKHHPIVYF